MRRGQHRRLPHPVEGVEDARDLLRLDPEPPDLDLVVGPAAELQAPVAGPADEIAGAVPAGVRAGVRVRQEPLRGELGAVQIAEGHARAADVQLPHRAHRDGIARLVQHAQAYVVDGPSDGDRCRGVPRGDGVRGAQDGDLGGPVHVDRLVRRFGARPGAQHVAAQQQMAQRRLVAGRQPQYLFAEGGGQDGEGDALLAVPAGEGERVFADLLVGDRDRRARGQRRPDLQERGVEALAAHDSAAVGGGEGEAPVLPLAQVDDGPVRHHDALGRAGAAGGVEHAARSVSGGAGRGRSGRVGGYDGDARGQVETGRLLPRRHHDPGPALGHDLLGTGPPEGRIERNTGAARLQDGEHGDDEVGGARQPQDDFRTALGVPFRERARQPLCPLVELSVRQSRVAADHGDAAGPLGGSPGDEVVERRVRYRPRGTVLPCERHRVAVGGRRGEPGQRRVGGLDGGGEQVAEGGEEPVDGPRVEQVGVVLQMAANALRLVGEVHGQVRQGLVRSGIQRGGFDAGQVEAERLGALELGERLEHRRPVHRPGRGEVTHHCFERDARVVVRVECGRAHAVEQCGERRVAGQVQAQREGVHEEPEQVLGPLGPVRDRGADDEVRLPGDPVQHRRVAGEQGHEQGAAAGSAQLAQSPREFGVEGVEDGTAVGRHRLRARPVGRQGEDGQFPAEGAAPVGQVLVRLGAARGRRLFPGVVGVRPGQRGEVDGCSVAFGSVEGREVAGEDGGGGGVDHDVVQGQHEHVLRSGEPDEPGDEQRSVREVETACALGGQHVLQAAGVRAVHDLEVRVGGRPYHLAWCAPDLPEDGAQALVTGDEAAQCGVQGGHVERTVEADRLDLVVRGTAREQALQEPDPFLPG